LEEHSIKTKLTGENMSDIYRKISFDTSEHITKAYSTSFSMAVGMLTPEIRKAIYSIYGFVRVADEIVDTFETSHPEALLNELTDNLDSGLALGISTNPVLHAFIHTIHQYSIPRELIDAFMASMRADLTKKRYQNINETDDYIYGSAKVVGLMCLRVFVNGDDKLYNELEAPAMNLGSAFQKVNFLRDLKADYEKLNRTYFHDFDRDTFDESIKEKIISDIEHEFKLARVGIKKLTGQTKLAVWLAFNYYHRLLLELKKTPASKILGSRIRVNNFRKLVLMNRAYLTYKLNLL
jgi:15-cis-phytoene synthase